MQQEDQLLIQRFLDGDAAAVAQVRLWITRAAWPYKSRFKEDWDDLCQDLMLEVTKVLQRGSFRGDSMLRTYLGRVVSSNCLDRMRVRSRWQWLDVGEALSGIEDEVAQIEFVPSRFEDRDLIRQVLRRTERECRRLWLMIVRGLSYSEMSERLGIKAGTLRVRVNRCRRRAVDLREELLGSDSLGSE